MLAQHEQCVSDCIAIVFVGEARLVIMEWDGAYGASPG